MKVMLFVAVGGALGALARYGVGLAAAGAWGERFPWGTLVVNLAGCLALGVIIEAQAHTRGMSDEMRLMLTTGFLGALTTFSTFGVETVQLVEREGVGLALGNIGANVLVGLAAAWIGVVLARTVWG